MVSDGHKLNHAKCVFATLTFEFLGHKIDGYGLHKSDKIYQREIVHFKTCFSSNHLHGHQLQKRCIMTKNALISPQVLMPYDLSLPLLLATDASKTELETNQNLTCHGYKVPEVYYTLTANCLLLEHRVVIPPIFRQPIIDDLHAAHVGIVKMKGVARSFVFWLGIDKNIKRIAKTCKEYAKHAHTPPKFRNHHWEYPKGPWERVYSDYAGPVAGMMLLVIDAYSKCLEVKVTSSTTSASTIAILDELFATYGTPVTIVSENGTQFTATEFKDFLQTNGVKYHKLTALYHPSTNGQAERYLQTVKDALKITNAWTNGFWAQLSLGDLHYEIDNFGKYFKRHVDRYEHVKKTKTLSRSPTLSSYQLKITTQSIPLQQLATPPRSAPSTPAEFTTIIDYFVIEYALGTKSTTDPINRISTHVAAIHMPSSPQSPHNHPKDTHTAKWDAYAFQH
ncbi:hypothetical protein RF55_10687 [Lasius niger]|uniref:RNA-directed DNA polymerase n=1 Tax=Lasius niger TaxID=67767 RepID=A0A0J7KHF1_LASNI|nr:hypothetical protein RF55_10687 [Lasius niger]